MATNEHDLNCQLMTSKSDRKKTKHKKRVKLSTRKKFVYVSKRYCCKCKRTRTFLYDKTLGHSKCVVCGHRNIPVEDVI